MCTFFPNKKIMKEIQFFHLPLNVHSTFEDKFALDFNEYYLRHLWLDAKNILSCFIELTWFWFKSCFYHYIIMLCEGEYPFSFHHDFMLSHLVYCICVSMCVFSQFTMSSAQSCRTLCWNNLKLLLSSICSVKNARDFCWKDKLS